MTVALDTLEALVRSRRSVRCFQADPVPDDVLGACLELAMLAPSSHNLEPWEFVCVRDPVVVEALREDCLGQQAARTAPGFVVVVARPDRWRQLRDLNLAHYCEAGEEALVRKYRDTVPLIFEDGPLHLLAPVKGLAMSVEGLFRPTYRGPFGYWGQQLWATKSTALAVGTLMLALRAAGWDTCPLEGFDEARVKMRFGLPREARVVLILAAGKRAEGGICPQVRFDSSLFVRWV